MAAFIAATDNNGQRADGGSWGGASHPLDQERRRDVTHLSILLEIP